MEEEREITKELTVEQKGKIERYMYLSIAAEKRRTDADRTIGEDIRILLGLTPGEMEDLAEAIEEIVVGVFEKLERAG